MVARNGGAPIFATAGRERNSFYDTGVKFNPGPGAYSTIDIMGKDGKSAMIIGKRPDTSP